MEIHDFIVVGSGCTGAMAAQTLVEKGKKVLMLDGGITEDHYKNIQPQKNFTAIRREEKNQHCYFLGDTFESIPENSLGTGAQLTPARQYLVAETEKYLPLISDTFQPMESLALGGLGGGWGLGCCVFSENELKLCGLDSSSMKKAYQVIADRIGICSEKDDARKFTGAFLENLQSPPPTGETADLLLKNYQSKKSSLNKNGFYLGRPALALLTKDLNERNATRFNDMDFYDDTEKAAYRPAYTIDELKKKTNFQYEGRWLITKFTEKENTVEVHAQRIGTNEENIFHCRRLILAPGVLGTARIVLRSSANRKNAQLPLLCNPYTYLPCVVTSRLGKKYPENEIGFAQLSLFHDADGTESDVAMASLYTYRSLLLYRLLRETPLNFRDGRIFMQHLLPALLIAGIHHPEESNPANYVRLINDETSPTGDKLDCHYPNAFSEKIKEREKKFRSALKKIGARALKTVHPPIGASIHYAGVLPFSESQKEFSLHPSGRLNGTKNIFVADGSGFTFLPAKGLTLSLMANAHTVANQF